MIRGTRYVAPSVRGGDSISYSDLHDSPDVTVYEDGDPYFPGSKMCHQRRVTYRGTPITIIGETEYGDYNGSDIERSNHRRMLADFPWLVTITGSHGYCALAYLGKRENQNPALVEALDALDEYPIFDEDDTSAMAMEIENECWSDYGRREFRDNYGHGRETTLVGLLDALDPEHEHDGDLIADATVDEVWWEGCQAYGHDGPEIEAGGAAIFRYDDWFRRRADREPWSEQNAHARAALDARLARLALDCRADQAYYGRSDVAWDHAIEIGVAGVAGVLADPSLVKQALDDTGARLVLIDYVRQHTGWNPPSDAGEIGGDAT